MTNASRYLLDPQMVISEVPLGFHECQVLVQWCNDSRSRLGRSAYHRVLSHLTSLRTDPGLSPPRPIRAPVLAAITNLLTRAPFSAGREPVEVVFQPEYAGPTSMRALVEIDLHEIDAVPEGVIGTLDERWAAEREIEVSGGEITRLHVLSDPNLPTRDELRSRRREALKGARVLIVGGQAEARLINALVEEFALDQKNVSWEACEHSKPPRNLDAQIRGLTHQSPSYVVSITGKMGHATSGKIASNCAGTSVVLVEVESVTTILTRFREIADQASEASAELLEA